MAEKCIFCGKAVTIWSGIHLACGGVDQPACSECAEKYGWEPLLQRARLALDTGRAKAPETLEAFIQAEQKRQAESEKRKQAREELLNKAREGRRETTRCCGFEMVRDGVYTFADQTPFAMRMLPLYTPTMVLFRCEVCGQIKLFDAEFFPPEEGGAEPEPRPEPEQRPEAPKAEPVPEPVQPKPFRPSRSRFGKKPPWEK